MNDKNEKKSLGDKVNGTEPFTKKVARFSAFIYLALAITVVIVATVGIFSISYDYEESLAPISFPEVGYTNDNYSVPQIVITPDDIAPDNTPDEPVVNEESDVDAEVSTPEQRVMYYRPVEGEIIKQYSMDVLVFSETMGDYRVHSGVDIATPVGSEVLCFADGTVASVTDDYFYGMTVSVEHADGAVSYYMNLDPVLAENISVGSDVMAGQTLGYVGNTARAESADEAHLHFELRVNDVLVDPKTELP